MRTDLSPATVGDVASGIVEPAPQRGTDPSARPRLLVLLMAMTAVIVVCGVWGVLQLRPSQRPEPKVSMVAVGRAAPVPGGAVTVLSAEHVTSPQTPAGAGMHAVLVRLSLEPETAPRAGLLVGAMMLQGHGIHGSVAPEEDPIQLFPEDDGRPAEIALTYIVPDMSSELGIALPGGRSRLRRARRPPWR